MVDIIDIDDIKELLPLAEQFSAESGSLKVKESVFIENWKKLYSLGTGLILVARKDDKIVGALGFLTYDDMIDGEKCSTECFWFVSKPHRGCGLKLLDMYENICKEIGVKRIIMVHLSNLMPEKLHDVYTGRGYKEIEKHYSLEV